MQSNTKQAKPSLSGTVSATDHLLILVRAAETSSTPADQDRNSAVTSLRTIGESVCQYVQVPPQFLEAQVLSFLEKLQLVVGNLPERVGEFSIEEIELSAEVTAEGKVAFLGTGGQLGGTGGLTFTFKRKVPV
jgi:hypothetical protein